MAFDNILVVCVGNICRSPIAEAALIQQYPHKTIDSAGLSAVVGNGADPNALTVMSALGIDMSAHIAKQIDEALVKRADLILTMSDNQSKWIEDRWPHCRGKTFRIGHWIDQDIADPYRHELSVFEDARQDIFDSLKPWADKIS
ncbi:MULTISPECIES: low molecular weight protein-tyrosine-phosphatase [Psychrobacter]|jgi:protein-tyrosine phosphatase|uniref:low molecular weight protein-tyrosine-phosphatase n=1 Tax=Psychrobacter TaxID=497 RepID=UPI00188D46B5|nr:MULTISPECIES: low molecular weight protein-tyrosine-phosphatase [Psychrobacter]MBF4489750.1 low molecular weight phosphotyrosine protein phosphatase [Psychrobacter sp. N25K4-3-2]MCH1783782.1 low molecular weight phosphotyrosine protein phosphatase [Psychrobacter glaciei]